MNERGSSWLETLLTLSIIMLIFGSLLPITTTMLSKITNKQMEAKAMEIAYQGAILYRSYGILSGERKVDSTMFIWTIEESGICVQMYFEGQEKERCVTL